MQDGVVCVAYHAVSFVAVCLVAVFVGGNACNGATLPEGGIIRVILAYFKGSKLEQLAIVL